MKQTTIIFGAGASFNSIPIVEKMVNHIPTFLQQIGNLLNQSDGEKRNSLEILVKYISSLNDSLEFTSTPDASLQKFYRDQNEDFSIWLKVFWIYLTSLEYVKKNFIDVSSEEHKLVTVDKRYSEFISSYFFKNQEDINFLSWNYDVQFERAYAHMIENCNSIEDAFDNLGSLNFAKGLNDTPKLLHLNGLLGVYDFIENGKSQYQNIFDLVKPDMTLNMLLNELLWILENEYRDKVQLGNTLGFAFTKLTNQRNKLKSIIQKMVLSTERLVFIGYSFPPMNEGIDKIIIENTKKDSQIVIQNPKAQSISERVQRIFNIEKSRILLIEDVDIFQA